MNKFFTIGYGGRRPADFAALLAQGEIATVVDVRLRPDRASTGSYVKAKSPDKGIQKLLSDSGIGYVSLLELGNVFLGCDDWRERYRELVERAGDLLVQRLASVPQPFCLLCAEKDVADCHRAYLAAYLQQAGWEVEHL